MPTDIKDELKAFERELASVVARFLRLYDRVETQVRPEAVQPPSPPQRPTPPTLAGYH